MSLITFQVTIFETRKDGSNENKVKPFKVFIIALYSYKMFNLIFFILNQNYT